MCRASFTSLVLLRHERGGLHFSIIGMREGCCCTDASLPDRRPNLQFFRFGTVYLPRQLMHAYAHHGQSSRLYSPKLWRQNRKEKEVALLIKRYFPLMARHEEKRVCIGLGDQLFLFQLLC